MKKSKKVLNLNKLVISRLNNLSSITGGTGEVIAGGGLPTSNIPQYCPTNSITCPETYAMTCKSCVPCNPHLNTQNDC